MAVKTSQAVPDQTKRTPTAEIATMLGHLESARSTYFNDLSYVHQVSHTILLVTQPSRHESLATMVEFYRLERLHSISVLCEPTLTASSKCFAVLADQKSPTPVIFYRCDLSDLALPSPDMLTNACMVILHLCTGSDSFVRLLLLHFRRVSVSGADASHVYVRSASGAPGQQLRVQIGVKRLKDPQARRFVPIQTNYQFHMLAKYIFDNSSFTVLSAPRADVDTALANTLPRPAQGLSPYEKAIAQGFIQYLHSAMAAYDNAKSSQLLCCIVLNAFSMAHKGQPDSAIYTYLREHYSRVHAGASKEKRARADELAAKASRMLLSVTAATAPRPRLESLIDIGCADGRVAQKLGTRLRIDAAHTYGVDVRPILATDAGITFLRCDVEKESLAAALGGAAFSLCTTLMVLHHLQDWRRTVRQAHALLAAGGLLLIRESLPPSGPGGDLPRLMLDLQHGLYSCVLNRETTVDAFVGGFYTSYLYEDDLLTELRAAGFAVLATQPDYAQDKFCKCWVVAQKQGARPPAAAAPKPAGASLTIVARKHKL